MWYAKPNGLYAYDSTEGTANIWEIYNMLDAEGYSLEAICGVGGSVITESGLNPWRWQDDIYNTSAGYGLFQYTPASQYLSDCRNVTGYAPNLSVSQVTQGANVSDAIAQMTAMINNLLGKWVSTVWRDYWQISSYPNEYLTVQDLIQVYGSNGRITQNQYKLIDNYSDAAIVFMCCFEGPPTPAFRVYERNAFDVYDILTGTPPQPPTPIYTRKKRRFPIWMMDGYKIRGRF